MLDESLLTAGEAAGLLVGLLLLVLAALTARRKLLERRFPCFEVSVRTEVRPLGRGWTLGLGCYDGDLLRWYRLLSFRTRPRLTLDRRTLQVTGSRCPTGPEARALLTGHVVLAVTDGQRTTELGVGDAVRTHLTAWIETAARSGGGLRPLGAVATGASEAPAGASEALLSAGRPPAATAHPLDQRWR